MLRIKVWPEHGRVVYLESGVLKRVASAVGTVLTPYALQVLAGAAARHGLVAGFA